MVQVLVWGVLQRGDNLHVPGKKEGSRQPGIVSSCQGHSGGLWPHGLHPPHMETVWWLWAQSPISPWWDTVVQPAPWGCGPPPPQAACMGTLGPGICAAFIQVFFFFPHSAVWLWFFFLCVCGFLVFFFFSKMSYMATFCLSDLMLGSRPGDPG